MSISPAVSAWYLQNRRALPWRAPGFSAWGILVSEVMLQQTQVARVVGPLLDWLERWPTPPDLAAASPGDALRAWGRLGYPRRALNLHASAVAMAEHHGGQVPTDLDALLALPGIGQYTARAIAVFAHGQRHPVVDTNVRRVVARAIGGRAEASPPSTRRDHAAVEAVLPPDAAAARVASAAIMELGAIVCTARAPRCDTCPIATQCAWRLAGYPAYEGPRRAPSAAYHGSDRQARGAILALLRERESTVTGGELDAVWDDPLQRARALSGLLADGLVTEVASGYALP